METGKSLAHDSAEMHVTGAALYTDDSVANAGELVVGFVGSPVAHGLLKRIDLSSLYLIPGFVGAFTWQDIPGANLFGPVIADEPFLVKDVCEYVGQPIVVLAAENSSALRKARLQVQIEVEEKTPWLTISQSLRQNSFLGNLREIKRGDFEGAWRKAEHQIEGVFYSNGQEQFYLESQAVIAHPGEGNEILIQASTQNPTELQEVVAHMLGIGFNEVICTCRRMGGAFGGKETQAALPALMAALVTKKTGRSGRIAYDKDTDMHVTGKRHPFRSEYQAAVGKEGNLLGLKVELYSNGGAYTDLSLAIMERALLHVDNAYFIQNITLRGQVCKTHLPPNTAFRGFGGPQGMAVVENLMEDIAAKLRRDPYEIRSQNCYGNSPRDFTPYGQRVESRLPQILNQIHESSDYKTRLEKIRQFNEKSLTHLRGISLTPMKFGISFTATFLNQANALINILKDGSVQVSTGGTEMGQGLTVKIRQIVAEELGVPSEQVKYMTTSTEKNHNTSPTAASAGTDLNGMAAANACQAIRSRLAQFAAELFADTQVGLSKSPEAIEFSEGKVWDRRCPEKQVTFGELALQAYRNRVNLGERGFYRTPGVGFNQFTGKGSPFHYYTTGACVAEVEIDRFTGQWKLERADLLLDIGHSINPGIDRGQIVGGFVQGLGWVSMEELRYQEDGKLLSCSPTSYKIPNFGDLPKDLRIELYENPAPNGSIRKSKAVGEPPLMLALAAFTAVKQALEHISPGKIVPLAIPATSEEVLRCMTWLGNPEAAWGLTNSEIPLISKPGQSITNKAEKVA
ncbi:MAG: xanthine dehydrogenase molybdopterin binding subunit [SAR324 cluster bacterium]|nr:xanthine dehydrogenase molybdopterin binding subunit [SAR324 cluster bacterium]